VPLGRFFQVARITGKKTMNEQTSAMSGIQDAAMAIDVLEREIFRYTAESITQELEINITRTAYSPLIQEARDYCVALMTPDFRPYMHSEASIPIFATDMGEPVRDGVETIGVENLEAGDVFVYNYRTGQHLNNVTMATPLFHGDKLTGFLALRAHWADVGGLVPGGQSMSARSIFHEGVRYRGLRLMRAGKLEREVMATIQANTWQIEALTGDVMAQLGACVLGAQRWQERVVSRWNADEVQALATAHLAASEAYSRAAIKALPDGTYISRRDWVVPIEGNDVELNFELKIIVDGDRMVCDLTGMPPQSELPINGGTIGAAMAAIRLGYRYTVGGNAPVDAGFFAPLEFIIPEGTIVSATNESAMGMWNMAIGLMVDLFIMAIGDKVPELVPASHNGALTSLMLYGKNADGSLWRFGEAILGGCGAEKDADGDGPYQNLFIANMKALPVEMMEGRYPIRVHTLWLDRSAGGNGLHRGGPAAARTIELLDETSCTIYPQANSPAPGLMGGEPGKAGAGYIKLPNTTEWVIPDDHQTVPAGTLIRQVGSGGGGWGKPQNA
jgi:N-methylhydantoinase B